MTFTLALTAFATVGGIIFGTLLAMMRLSGFAPISVLAAGAGGAPGVKLDDNCARAGLEKIRDRLK
jgi:hypothetical protein